MLSVYFSYKYIFGAIIWLILGRLFNPIELDRPQESGAPMRNGRIRSGRAGGGGVGHHGFSVGDTPNRPSNGFVSSDLGRTKHNSVPTFEPSCSAKCEFNQISDSRKNVRKTFVSCFIPIDY